MRQFLFVLLSVCALSSFAQNSINIDNLRFNYVERNEPRKTFSPLFFAYSSNISVPSTLKGLVDEDMLNDNILIEGQRVAQTNSDIDMMVRLNLGSLNIISSDVMERVEEEEDKKSGVIREKYFFWLEVRYSLETNAQAFWNNKVASTYPLHSRDTKLLFKSTEYDTRKGASNYWRNNKESLIEQFVRDVTLASISKLNSALSADYGFPLHRSASLIKTINEKKHPENDQLRAMSNALKSQFEALNGSTPLVEEDLSDIIAYFKNIPVRYTDPKLKTDVRLRYVAYYNLCRIYLFLDKPEKVKQWADLLLKNGHDKKDCERLNNDATKLMQELRAKTVKSRQFDPVDYW